MIKGEVLACSVLMLTIGTWTASTFIHSSRPLWLSKSFEVLAIRNEEEIWLRVPWQSSPCSDFDSKDT